MTSNNREKPNLILHTYYVPKLKFGKIFKLQLMKSKKKKLPCRQN